MPSPPKGQPKFFPKTWRVALALAYAIFSFGRYGGLKINLQEAVDFTWDKEWGPQPERVLRHCKLWHTRLIKTQGVKDRKRATKTLNITDAQVIEAHKLIIDGYVTTRQRGGKAMEEERKFFHSINDAIRYAPRLQQIMRGVTRKAAHLRRRIRQLGLKMVFAREDTKPALNAAQCAARVQSATQQKK